MPLKHITMPERAPQNWPVLRRSRRMPSVISPMGRWASKEEGPKRFANRLDGLRSFDSAVRPKNAQSALLVSQIASNHRSGTFRHGRSLLAPSSALKPADYLLGLRERPPHPISVGRAACVAQ